MRTLMLYTGGSIEMMVRDNVDCCREVGAIIWRREEILVFGDGVRALSGRS